MFFVVAAVVVVGIIAVVGGGHTVSGLKQDTRNTSSAITRSAE